MLSILTHKITGILLSLFCCYFAISQTKTFKLKTLGLQIGKLEAHHSSKDGYDIYMSQTVIDFVTMDANIKTESVYQEGMLIKSVVTSTINGKSYLSKTTWKKNHYQIDCHARSYHFSDSTLTTPIKWSAGKLYFEIPPSGALVYAESYGVMGTLESVEKNALRMTTPESKQIYYYDEGFKNLIRIEVVNKIKDFDMIPDSK